MFNTFSDRQHRAQAAVLLGLTDLFVGASAIALLLIVATRQTSTPVQIPKTDYLVRCIDSSGLIELRAVSEREHRIVRIGANDPIGPHLDARRLNARMTVVTTATDLRCLWRIRAKVDGHNRALGKRDQIPAPILQLDWMAEDPPIETEGAPDAGS